MINLWLAHDVTSICVVLSNHIRSAKYSAPCRTLIIKNSIIPTLVNPCTISNFKIPKEYHKFWRFKTLLYNHHSSKSGHIPALHICNSYNMGTTDLPDIYAQALPHVHVISKIHQFRHSNNLPKPDENCSVGLYSSNRCQFQ